MEKKNKEKQPEGNNKLLKKRKNEPDHATENLDIPGANLARPLTNDRDTSEKNQDKLDDKNKVN